MNLLVRSSRTLITAISFVFLASAVSSAATGPAPSAAMMAPVRRIVAFVNTEAAIPAGTYAAGATITDEFAPFHWTTGDVGAQWSTRFTTSNNAAGITKPHIVLGVPSEFNMISSRAYIVFPCTFTPLMDGKPYTETGYWTFVVVRDGAVWHVASQTWAGVTFR